MANKGKTLYLKIFVMNARIDLDAVGLYMGSYVGSPTALDFMLWNGSFIAGGGGGLVFDSSHSTAFNLLASPTVSISKSGDMDNFGKYNHAVTAKWAIDGVETNTDLASIEALDGAYRYIYVFDSDTGIIEELVYAQIQMESTTTGNGVQTFSFQATETGVKSQIYKWKQIPDWP